MRRHLQVQASRGAEARRVASLASQQGVLLVWALPPRESRSQQRERALGLWAPQLQESQLPAPWQVHPRAVPAQRAQQPVKVPRSRVSAPQAWPTQVPKLPAQQPLERTSPVQHSASSARP